MTYADAYLMQPEQVTALDREHVLRLRYVLTSMRSLLYKHDPDAVRHLNLQLPQRVGLAETKAHTLALLDACERYLEEPC